MTNVQKTMDPEIYYFKQNTVIYTCSTFPCRHAVVISCCVTLYLYDVEIDIWTGISQF